MERPAVQLGQGDGDVAGLSRYGPRSIVLDLAVRASSPADLKSKLSSAAAALGSKGDQRLILDESTDRYWMARPAGDVDWNQALSRVGVFSLAFVAGDPLGFAVTGSSASGSGPGVGSSVGIDCVVGGEEDTFPVITLTFTGACSGWALENEARDERLAWIAPGAALASGDVVRVESAPRQDDTGLGGRVVRIKRSGDPDYSVEMDGVEGLFPELTGAITNSITVHDVPGSVLIEWRNRFLTV
jgi:predicted phage tail component-like protein